MKSKLDLLNLYCLLDMARTRGELPEESSARFTELNLLMSEILQAFGSKKQRTGASELIDMWLSAGSESHASGATTVVLTDSLLDKVTVLLSSFTKLLTTISEKEYLKVSAAVHKLLGGISDDDIPEDFLHNGNVATETIH